MEEELRCPACKGLYSDPVLLPCAHSHCRLCAAAAVMPASPAALADDDSDKASVLSEADSGVVCSRPPSFCAPFRSSILTPPPAGVGGSVLLCAACRKPAFLPDSAALAALPPNRALAGVVARHRSRSGATSPASSSAGPACQMCDGAPKAASVFCEQCDVFYCHACRTTLHPPRGPLAQHNLLPASLARSRKSSSSSLSSGGKESGCVEHLSETLSMFCMVCKTPVCALCLQDGRHAEHDVQSLGSICKLHKTELSQGLQSLSEKAKHASEGIARLKLLPDKINDSYASTEREVDRVVEELVAALRRRRDELVAFAAAEREYKKGALREQIGRCTSKLAQTTGLIQFCVEILKEPDPVAFLQVGPSLCGRVGNVELRWEKEMGVRQPIVPPDLDLSLDTQALVSALTGLNFAQLKAPEAPRLLESECRVEGNSVRLAWAPPAHAAGLDGFVLELDSGDGEWKAVYAGKDRVCTLDGLDFGTVYGARVRAYNAAGEGPHSASICLQTPEVAWFELSPARCHPELLLSNAQASLSGGGPEYRTGLGSVGFARGLHYWEVTVDRQDANADVVVGIARPDVDTSLMLGKDARGWSMYVDGSRSWFLHAETHRERIDSGGVGRGSVVGVLLNCEARTLAFFVNDKRRRSHQVGVAFKNLPSGVFHPAVSVNRNVQLTLHTGLPPPSSSSESDTASDEEPRP